MTFRLGSALVCFLLLPACGPTFDSTVEQSQSVSAASDGWFVVRADARKCPSPTCGGWFIKRVNVALTTCLDGVARAECYVAALDWSGTRFSDDERAKLASAPVVMHGRMAAASHPEWSGQRCVDLRVSDVWAPAVAPDLVDGYLTVSATLARAWDNGTRCITTPCPSWTEEKLNTSRRQPIAGVDLSWSCADDRQLDEANTALASAEGLLVDGIDGWVSGPGGTLRALYGLNFYLRVVPAEAQPRACGGFAGIACADGEYCDVTVAAACQGGNLPGVCKAVPQLCMQLYKPVCGCDGKTYANDCVRLTARVQLDHDGACAQ
jgi:hypothetical protein